MTEKKPQFTSTRQLVLYQIDQYLKAHAMEPETFGWLAVKDSGLVSRLRNKGDITTRKLDAIVRFLATTPKKKELKNGKESEA